MAGSPKKRARRLALAASRGRAGARAKAPTKTAEAKILEELLTKTAAKCRITPVPSHKVPSDARLLLIAKGVLLALARKGAPDVQVKAAWNLADLTRRSVPAQSDDLEKLSDEELNARAAAAERALGSLAQ